MAIDRNISTSLKSCRNCARLHDKWTDCVGCYKHAFWEPMATPKTDYTEYSSKTAYSGPRIKKVLFRNPATIVFWDDNTKTVVKCSELDGFDCEKGLAIAIAKKFFGNEGNYYNEFKKWLPEEKEVDLVYPSIAALVDSATTTSTALTALKDAIIEKYNQNPHIPQSAWEEFWD